MAKILRTDGSEEQSKPSMGRCYDLEELREIVGGYARSIDLNDGRTMVLNDLADVIGLPINDKATEIAHEAGVVPEDVFLLGDALICETFEMKYA